MPRRALAQANDEAINRLDGFRTQCALVHLQRWTQMQKNIRPYDQLSKSLNPTSWMRRPLIVMGMQIIDLENPALMALVRPDNLPASACSDDMLRVRLGYSTVKLVPNCVSGTGPVQVKEYLSSRRFCEVQFHPLRQIRWRRARELSELMCRQPKPHPGFDRNLNRYRGLELWKSLYDHCHRFAQEAAAQTAQ